MIKLCHYSRQCKGWGLLILETTRCSLKHVIENKWSWRVDFWPNSMAKQLETKTGDIFTLCHNKCPRKEWTGQHPCNQLKRNAQMDILALLALSSVAKGIVNVSLISITDQVLTRKSLLLETQANRIKIHSVQQIEASRVKPSKQQGRGSHNTGILHTT